ncbi:unnamed protein product [Ixodes hexagonus]
MGSPVGAVKTAVSGRGTSVADTAEDYKIILPQLPTGYVITNSFFLHCDVKRRPYRVQVFRHELERLGVMKDLASAGPHQMNHVWMLRMHSPAAKQRLVDARELTIKGGAVPCHRPGEYGGEAEASLGPVRRAQRTGEEGAGALWQGVRGDQGPFQGKGV